MANIEVDLKQYEVNPIDVHELIGEAMRKKDRIVMVYITKFGTTVTIKPMSEDAKWIIMRGTSSSTTMYACSECGQVVKRATTYCPHCGVMLTGGKEVSNE